MKVSLDVDTLKIQLVIGDGLQATASLSAQAARLVADQLNSSAEILEKLSQQDVDKLTGETK